MKKYGVVLGIMGVGLCWFLEYIPTHAQSVASQITVKDKVGKEWHVHPVTNKHAGTRSNASNVDIPESYHKKPSLYPSKHHSDNPLRKKGWHTHPDPYIEEGGAYSKEAHPAETDTQGTMREYTTGDPNQYVAPPPTVARKPSPIVGQQKIQIRNPLPDYVPPITLPSS